MRHAQFKGINGASLSAFALATLFLGGFVSPAIKAQNPELQARLTELKASMARNKQELAQYSWTEQDIISLKGEDKKEELFQVQLGPDGKPQKTNIDPNSMSDDERHRHGLRAHIVEKKKEEYKEYADEMKGLMQQYVPLQRELLDQAYQKGNLMFGPAGVPNEIKIVITNYIKPQDSVTLTFDKPQKRLLSMKIGSYLDDPSDAVKLNVEFSTLPQGPNHISSLVIDGVSKQLSVAVTNSNYQKL
jgi:hypothetical protein